MKNQKAFTLLELLITSSITALLMLAISSLFITFLATAYKSRISQNLRESGGNAMTQIIDMIRSSGEITSTCDSETPLDHITVTGEDGVESTIIEEDDRIASVSAEKKFYLTESSADSNYVSDLVFNCDLTPEGKKYIEVNFTLHTGDNEASNSARSTSLDFSSGVATRN
ncbi:prepilin-type N-terminal cleavage/methylation domain-containing protein [Patescibacteria group bacterium]|nr:prepilin-type N-terminal cleavage/methylation domain-containing protein [Patescibacteria group bacterium]